MNKKVSLLCFVLLIGFTSCNQGATDSTATIGKDIEPVVVSVKSGSIEEMKSYSTDVTFYSGNNREIGGITEQQKYRLSVKEIDGNIHTRIDYPSEMFTDGVARSSLTTDSEMFIFQTSNNELEHRQVLEIPEISQRMEVFSGINRMMIKARIPDFSNFRVELFDIASDISENVENNLMLVKLPMDDYDEFSLTFDLEEEVLLNTESKEVLEDGTTLTTTTEYVYQDVDGELIKVGEILESSFDVEETIDISGYELPIIESEDDVEEMSLEDIDALEEEGGIAYDVVPVLGDPADLDYIETDIQLFDNIEINAVDESIFRVMW